VASNKGWFSETSVQYMLYSLSRQSTGFTPIWSTLTSPAFVNGTPVTQIHSFAAVLKTVSPTAGTALGSLMTGENIQGNDAFGAGEANNGGVPESLPLYRTAVLGTPLTNVCFSAAVGASNKLGNFLYVRVQLPAAGSRTIAVTGGTAADPDFAVYQNGLVGVADGADPGSEVKAFTLTAGTAVIVLTDFNLTAASAPAAKCFTVSVQ
jgi:hypothetical protein